MPFAEEFDGFGGSIIDVAAIMQEFGKVLLVEPVFSTLVLFGGILGKSDNQSVKAEIIPQIIDGSLFGAVAMYESQSRFDYSNVETTAKQSGDNYLLNGTKTLVVGANDADKIVVVARTSGESKDQSGISLFLVDASLVAKCSYKLMDGRNAADIALDNIEGTLISELNGGYQMLEAMMKDANVALCAEALGIMEKLNTTTVDYTKTRKQFGVAISSFQALQHRMVDTFSACEQVKSLLLGTLCELTDDTTTDNRAGKLVSALRTLTARNGKLIGDEAIQMHGGMGLTDELDVGHYVKRLMMINLLFGNGDFHQAKFNELAYQSA